LAFETKTRLSLAQRRLDLVELADSHVIVVDAMEAGTFRLPTSPRGSRTNLTGFTTKERSAFRAPACQERERSNKLNKKVVVSCTAAGTELPARDLPRNKRVDSVE
jgi:hypothetical protein